MFLRLSIALVFIQVAVFLTVPYGIPYAMALNSMAEAYADQGNQCYSRQEFGKAAMLFDKAVKEEESHENDQLFKARLYNNLGSCYLKLAEDKKQAAIYESSVVSNGSFDYLELAKTNLMESLRIKEEKSDSKTDFIYIAKSLENLARVFYESNQTADAEALFRKAMKIRESKEGADSPELASDYLSLGDVLSHDNPSLFKEAEGCYLTALQRYRKASKVSDPVIGKCHEQLAILYFKWNKVVLAGDHYDEALRIYKTNQPTTSPNLNALLSELRDLPVVAYSSLCSQLQQKQANKVARSELFRDMIKAANRLGPAGKQDSEFFRQQLAREGRVR
jgi:tetratricopeptide (TPR) repeat protein